MTVENRWSAQPKSASRWWPALLLILIAAGCSRPGGSPEAQADLVIRGGTLIDMVAGAPQPMPVKGVVLAGGKIQRILAADSPDELPRAPQVIDAASNYILPGYIDAHIHFQPWHPAPTLHYGVTTVMDTGPCGENCAEDPNEWILRYQRPLMAPDSPGPALYITGMKLDGPEGKKDKSVWRLQSLDEIPQKMDFLMGMKVNAIKAEEFLPLDFRKRIIEEAEKRNLPVVGHEADAREAISVGMKFIEHMYPIARSLAPDAKAAKDLDPSDVMDMSKAAEFIQHMIDNQVYLNPTMVGRYEHLSGREQQYAEEDAQLLATDLYRELPKELHKEMVERHYRAKLLKPAELAKLKKGYENVKVFVKQFSERGGLLLSASDSGASRVPGISFHREMQLLVDAGVTPYRALLGATRTAAQSMRMEKMLGTVEPGKQADLVILASNPVENIDAARNIRYVIRKGAVRRAPK